MHFYETAKKWAKRAPFGALSAGDGGLSPCLNYGKKAFYEMILRMKVIETK